MAWWSRALDLLYPSACPGCDRSTQASRDFCDLCLATIHLPRSPLCSVCGDPFAGIGEDHPCHRCLALPRAFGVARAGATYASADDGSSPLARALQRYKYTPDVGLAPVLGGLMASRFSLDPADYDVIVPVPLHIRRLRWRGFNQALLLARHVGKHHRLRVDPFVLVRTRATDPQVELDDAARRRNVAGAFAVTGRRTVEQLRVLLVDDVYTTGATADECSRTLLRAGATRVDVAVLARAVLH
jgi:ComF family protein